MVEGSGNCLETNQSNFARSLQLVISAGDSWEYGLHGDNAAFALPVNQATGNVPDNDCAKKDGLK